MPHVLRLRACALQFGYTRKDVILLGGGIIGFGYALYYGLQAAGVDSLVAGNFVQLFVFLGIGVGYISTYLFRVANKVCCFLVLFILRLCHLLHVYCAQASSVSITICYGDYASPTESESQSCDMHKHV